MATSDVDFERLYGRHIPIDGKAAAKGLEVPPPKPLPTARPFVKIEKLKDSCLVVGVEGEF